MPEKVIKSTSPKEFNELIQGRYGYMAYNKNDQYIGSALEKYGEYCEQEVNLYRQICKPGDTVIEAGANIGSHTIALSQFVGDRGRIIAFEPQRVVFQTLCATMALNSITNVEAYPMAVSTDAGYAHIPEIDYRRGGNYGSVSVTENNNDDNRLNRVPSISLDTFIELDKLKLIKIDVEGMEFDVIKGAEKLIRRLEPILYVENDRQEKSQQLIELIASLGYRIFWHLPKLFNKDNFAKDNENIFGNYVAVNLLCLPKSSTLKVTDLHEVTDHTFHPMRKS